MSGEQFSLVWNSFPSNLSSGLYTLLTDEQLVDVTLAAEGQILRAHKLILSVCSTYFKELFKENSCKHPIVILKDVNYRDLSAMLHFMYQGEVNIKQEDIASFLKVAETLQIKGLTTEKNEKIEETFTKNDENSDEMMEKNKINCITSETRTQEFNKLTEPLDDGHQVQKQNISSNDRTFMEQNVMVNVPYRHPISDQRCENVEVQNNEEPLDCTANLNDVQRIKCESVDNKIDMSMEARYNPYPLDEILYKPKEELNKTDFVSETQLLSYNQDSQNSTFGLNNMVTALQNDVAHDTATYNKGRRTVKDIPNSILPLETTSLVVSELRPTLRMERGKMIRMYSCPWCLRHFTRKENLKHHVRYIHGPLESLTCKLCGNKYKNSNSLRVHSYLYHNVKRDKRSKPPLVSDGL